MDLKLQNIQIFASQILLSDFGSTLLLPNGLTNEAVGTAYATTLMYCAPELAAQGGA